MTRTRAGNGHWDGLIVLCATSRYDAMPMGDWHLARALSRTAPVLYVDPPMSPLTPLRGGGHASRQVWRPGLDVPDPAIARLTPVVQPFPSRPGMAGLTSLLTRRYLRLAIARLGGTLRAVISGWPMYPMHRASSQSVSVYWAKDDFVAGAALLGESARQLDRRERRIAAWR